MNAMKDTLILTYPIIPAIIIFMTRQVYIGHYRIMMAYPLNITALNGDKVVIITGRSTHCPLQNTKTDSSNDRLRVICNHTPSHD